MFKNVWLVLVLAGALVFFVGSVIENEMVYSVSGCVAVWSGLVMAIQKNRAEQTIEATPKTEVKQKKKVKEKKGG